MNMLSYRMEGHPIRGVRPAAFLMLIGSVAVIVGALLFQYVGKLEPCELCLLERWPYYLGIPLLVTALLTEKYPMVARVALIIVAVLFTAGGFVSAYHVGVEQHWIAGPTACTNPTAEANSIEALKAQLLAQEPVNCDVVQWSLIGISLAGWNLIAQLALVSVSAIGLRAERRRRRGR
jgi:disulfide bond formation protein DsbB